MSPIVIIFLTCVLISAAVFDIRIARIPNLLNYPAMVVGIAYHGMTRGMEGLLFSIGGLILGIFLLLLPYLMDGMGAGDAKLMGAVGAFLGPKGVFLAFLFTAFVGGIYALILIVLKRKPAGEILSRTGTIFRLFLKGEFVYLTQGRSFTRGESGKLYYGAAVAVGTLCYILWQMSGTFVALF